MFYKDRKNKKNIISIPRNISEILPGVLSNIEDKYKKNPSNIIASWPEIIGKKLAPMTKVISYSDGILIIKVKSSTLYSLLNNYEKDKLLQKLQDKFSKKIIQKIHFKLG